MPVHHLAAAVLTAVYGAWAVVHPAGAAGLAEWSTDTPRRVAEARTSLGALWLGLGMGAFVFPAGAPVLGCAYAAMALARAGTVLLDGDRSRANVLVLALECALGALLLWP